MKQKLLRPLLLLLLLLSGCYTDAQYNDARDAAYDEGYQAAKEEDGGYTEGYIDALTMCIVEAINDPDAWQNRLDAWDSMSEETKEIMLDDYAECEGEGIDEIPDLPVDDSPDQEYQEEPKKPETEGSSGSSTSSTDTQTIIVYVTNTGEKYHVSNCGYLSQSKNELSLSQAKAAGYTPCSRCHPPQ